MTGLNLESFLHLLRADLGAWATLALIVAVLALMAWTSWGSRRALRKCLVLSVMAHFGLALYGGTVPVVMLALQSSNSEPREPERIRQIKVDPRPETEPGEGESGGTGKSSRKLAAFDRTWNGLALADAKIDATRPDPTTFVPPKPADRAPLAAEPTTPESTTPAPAAPETRASPAPSAESVEKMPEQVKPGAEDVAAPVVNAIPKPEPNSNVPENRIRAERAVPSVPVPGNSRPVTSLAPLPDPPPPQLSAPFVLNAPEPIPRTSASNTNEPAPASATEIGDRDVAAVEVVPARPESRRLEAADANLRTRTRPGAIERVVPDRSANRSPLVLGPNAAATPRIEGPTAPGPLAERVIGAVGGLDSVGNTAKPLVLGEIEVASPPIEKETIAPLPRLAPPESDIRRLSRPSTTSTTAPETRKPSPVGELALSRVAPTGVPALPMIQGAAGGRPLNDVPEVYRSRLDPNRVARAYRAGASPASEQAVERALDWLSRHQDTDGRWDGATAHLDDGTPMKGDDDYTVHCPPGEPCFGQCIYWEADTALTGLALLAYLGAGYTQTDGKYAESVGKGLDFLILAQKPDGDLRGQSRAVGMYCQAMATIALCEAYALTGDERLRGPVERAVGFLARSRARDGLSWRYAPGEPVGDTSILGWVVMALKSAKEVGIAVPSQIQTGTLGWLSKVASGESNGLARYQPSHYNVTPTMTAEAWVCRQFLGVGGPGPASSEAAEYLLAHGPKSGGYNLYYWYYGTLAMYQHGGPAWTRWNGEVRDEIVSRQRPQGHAAGSWDPDDSPYGSRGGRIYCTAMATLSLEVYYRYLRLYDDPKIPPALAPRRPRNNERSPDRIGGERNSAAGVGANR